MIKKWADYRNDFLSQLYERFSELNTYDALVKKYLSEKTAQHCSITSVQKDTIIISAANAGILSLLRYEKSTLLQKLRTEEKMYALRSIELKLAAPHFRPYQQKKMPYSAIYSQKSCESIHATANHCEHLPLKQALERLEQTLAGHCNGTH